MKHAHLLFLILLLAGLQSGCRCPREYWEVPQGPVPLKMFDLNEGTFISITVRPDGNEVAVGGAGRIYLFTPELQRIKEIALVDGLVKNVAYSPDGKRLAAVINSSFVVTHVLVIDLQTAQTLWQIDDTKMTDRSGFRDAQFSNDGTMLAISTADTLWLRSANGEIEHDRIKLAGPSTDGRQFCFMPDDNYLLETNGRVNHIVKGTKELVPLTKPVKRAYVTFSADGRSIYECPELPVQLYGCAERARDAVRVQAFMDPVTKTSWPASNPMWGRTIRGTAHLQNGKVFAVADLWEVSLFDTETGQLIDRLGVDAGPSAVGANPRGAQVYAISDTRLRRWDIDVDTQGGIKVTTNSKSTDSDR